MSDEVVVGAPTPLLLSARRWGWKHISGPHAIDLKVSGEVPVGKDNSMEAEAVSFNVADDISVRVDFGAIIKMMFSNSSYPELKDNEMFSISDVLINREGGEVTIVGNILEKLIA